MMNYDVIPTSAHSASPMATEDQATIAKYEKYFNRNWDQFLDKITIHDLLVQAIIGVNAKERNNPQKILLNVTIYTDTSEAVTLIQESSASNAEY
jgi:hypothetical protein